VNRRLRRSARVAGEPVTLEAERQYRLHEGLVPLGSSPPRGAPAAHRGPARGPRGCRGAGARASLPHERHALPPPRRHAGRSGRAPPELARGRERHGRQPRGGPLGKRRKGHGLGAAVRVSWPPGARSRASGSVAAGGLRAVRVVPRAAGLHGRGTLSLIVEMSRTRV